MPKSVAHDANEERLRMLEEDADDDDVHSSVDRFRDSRRSIVSSRTVRSHNTSFSETTLSCLYFGFLF